MINPAHIVEELSNSIFNELALKKAKKIKQGTDIIDLGIGSPDQPPPQFVQEALANEVLRNNVYGYSLTGTDEFSQAVVSYYSRRFGVNLQKHHVLQLMGSQDGLAHISLAYLDPGELVIVPDPGYPIYSASVHLARGTIYPVPLLEENHFKPDLESIPIEVRQKAKMMIVNYPGNPVSSLADEQFFNELIRFGIENEILIIHDFAYCELIFNGHRPLSILSVADAEKIALEFNSFSKSYNMAGCRIGYLLGAPELLKPLAIVKSHVDYGVFYPIQKAACIALEQGDKFLEENTRLYENRRDTFVSQLHEIGWPVKAPQGGMFIWGKVPPNYNSLQFFMAALDRGVVVTPGHAFGQEGEGYVRMALVHSEETLIEAAQRLKPLML